MVEDANGWELNKDDLCLARVARENECAGARLTKGKLALMRCIQVSKQGAYSASFKHNMLLVHKFEDEYLILCSQAALCHLYGNINLLNNDIHTPATVSRLTIPE